MSADDGTERWSFQPENYLDSSPTAGDGTVYVVGFATVCEVETDYTNADIKRKLDHFHIGPVRDVILTAPADVPSEPEAAVEYLLQHEVIGGQH